MIPVSNVWAEEQKSMRSVAVDSEFLFRPINPDLPGFPATNGGVNTLERDSAGNYLSFLATQFYSLGETVDQKSMTESADQDLLRSDGGRDLDVGDTPRSVTFNLMTASSFITHDFLIRNRNTRFQGFLRTTRLKRLLTQPETPITRYLFIPNFQFLRSDQTFPNTGIVRYPISIIAYPVRDVVQLTYDVFASAFAKGETGRFGGNDSTQLAANIGIPGDNNAGLYFKPYRGTAVLLAQKTNASSASWVSGIENMVVARITEEGMNPFYVEIMGRFWRGLPANVPPATSE
jgi:hypothetical protein